MATTIFELNEKLAQLGAQISADAEWIAENAANPATKMEDIEKKTAHRDDTQVRFDLLKAERDKMEDEARAQIKLQEAIKEQNSGTGDKNKRAEQRGEFYKAVLTGGGLKKAYEMLGGIPANSADLGYGDRLIPTTMTNELVVEPAVENPMRTIVRVSNITGLEEPKLTFDLGDAFDSITDLETANEIEMTGDSIIYDRNKVKVRAKVSDTVIHGSPFALASEIDNALRSGLAANEMLRMFAATPLAGYEKMSFYSAVNNVKRVSAGSKQAAIAAALADLPIAYRRNAKIVMNAVDWYEMWAPNLNQSGMFYEDRPLMLFGKPVVLIDDASDPVVGDFQYARINYDIVTVYDTDKDVDAGVYKFVLTAWYDIRLRLASAFRIAHVNP